MISFRHYLTEGVFDIHNGVVIFRAIVRYLETNKLGKQRLAKFNIRQIDPSFPSLNIMVSLEPHNKTATSRIEGGFAPFRDRTTNDIDPFIVFMLYSDRAKTLNHSKAIELLKEKQSVFVHEYVHFMQYDATRKKLGEKEAYIAFMERKVDENKRTLRIARLKTIVSKLPLKSLRDNLTKRLEDARRRAYVNTPDEVGAHTAQLAYDTYRQSRAGVSPTFDAVPRSLFGRYATPENRKKLDDFRARLHSSIDHYVDRLRGNWQNDREFKLVLHSISERQLPLQAVQEITRRMGAPAGRVLQESAKEAEGRPEEPAPVVHRCRNERLPADCKHQLTKADSAS